MNGDSNADDQFSQGIAERTKAKVIFAGIETTRSRHRRNPEPTGCGFTVLEGAHRCRAQLPVPEFIWCKTPSWWWRRVAPLGFPGGLRRRPWVFRTAHEGAASNQEINGIQLITNDSYNANPDSMKRPFAMLVELDAYGRRVAVLVMSELGEESAARPPGGR